MRIIGVDLHTRQQSVAMLDTDTGEVIEKTLEHEGDEVREFYSALPGPVLVDCRKVTITSCYASKLVWRQTAKYPSAATNVRNSAASLNRVLYRPATSFAPSSS